MLLGFQISADPNKIFWYPLRFLGSVPFGVDIFVIGGYAIGAAALFAYVKRATGLVAAGIASAATFTLGGFEFSHFGHPMLVHPAAWACVALWSLDAFQRDGRGWQLAVTAVAEALSIASGQPQIAAFSTLLLVAHLFVMPSLRSSWRTSLLARVEGLGALGLGMGLAATVWIPTRHLALESVRAIIGYPEFVVDALPLAHVARALAFPYAIGSGMESLYRGPFVVSENGAFTEVTCYVAASALILAAVALIARPRRATFFWAFIALAGLGLAVGNDLPFAPWTYTLPIYGLFRIPGRHAFEFTLAAAILAGFGIDALAHEMRRTKRIALVAAVLGTTALYAIAFKDVVNEQPLLVRASEVTLFLALLAAQALLALVATLRLGPRARTWCLTAAVLIGAFPFAETGTWRDAPTAAILQPPPWASVLARLPLESGQRVYTTGDRPELGLEANLPMIWNVPDVRAYTPLQPRDAHVFLQTGEDGRLLDPTAPTLDLAAVRYIIVPTLTDDVLNVSAPYAPAALNVFLSGTRPEAPLVSAFAPTQPRRATAIGFVTALGLSVDVPQHQKVADLVVGDVAGRSQTFALRAGEDTAEIAYDRPGLAPTIRHRQSHIFVRGGGATWYDTTRELSLSAPIASVIVRLTDTHIALNVRNISLFDPGSGHAYPLSAEAPFRSDPRRFRVAADVAGVTIFENLQARPGTWIADRVIDAAAPTTDASVATLRERLRRIDVARAILLDDPAAANAEWGGGSATPLVLRAEQRVVRTTCLKPCLLVVSEKFTASWSATVDARPVPVLRVDGILQAVAVPPGRHVVDLRYRSHELETAMVASAASALALGAWLFVRSGGSTARRRRTRVRVSG